MSTEQKAPSSPASPAPNADGAKQRRGSAGRTVPRAGPFNKLLQAEVPLKPDGTGLKSRGSSRFLSPGPQEKLIRLPSLKATEEKEALFIRKLKQCCVVFDFTKPINLAEEEQKEIKRETLLELLEFLLTQKLAFTPAIYRAVFSMVSTNLFRPLAPRLNPIGERFEVDDDEPILEAAWPHVQIVYEFFLRFVESTEFDAQAAKQFLHRNFITQMLDLFDSEDPRERDYLKTTLHRIYGKFLSLRGFIRRQIKYIFQTFALEHEYHNGIAELLEILGSIINGFNLPLKDEHKEFLIQGLIPLHKPKNILPYHPQLSYCVAQYIEKDPNLTELVFKSLIRYWPVANTRKQLLFLTEIEDLLQVVEPEQFVVIHEMLFKKLTEAIVSPAFQIVEKVFQLWHHEYILNLIATNIDVILPIVFPSLYSTAKNHWNKAIRSMAANDIRLFMDIDTVVFGRVLENYKKERTEEKEERDRRVSAWRSLFQEVEPEKLQSPIPAAQEADKPSSDPLLYDNEGLPSSVKIPHHLNLISVDDFDANEQFFKDLDRLTQLRITDTLNKKLRQKELLPMDRLAYEALYNHESLDPEPGDEQSGEPHSGSSDSDYSDSNSGEGSSESYNSSEDEQ